MKRLIEKFVTGLARLAFWRKLVPVVEESQESALPVFTELRALVSAPDSASEPVIPDSPLPELTAPDQSIPDTMSTELLELSEHSVQPEQPEPVATTGTESEESALTPTFAVATPDQAPAIQEPSGAVAPTDAVPEKLSLLARLRKLFRRKINLGTEENTEPGQPESELPDGRKSDQAGLSVSADVPTEAAPEKLSLLTRLKNVFRRKSGPDAENDAETAASHEAAHAVEGEAVEVGRLQRVRARLSNKWVWIPGLSIILLVPLVTMAWMLVQSTQEKARLQVELQAAQKKLEQPSPTKQSAASQTAKKPTNETLEPGENSMPVSAGGGVDSTSAVDAGDCVVTDQASVLKNLKNCIEGFNRTSAR